MNIAKLKFYFHKSLQLGPQKVAMILANRVKTAAFQSYIRRRALQKKAHCAWGDIAKRHALSPAFADFLSKQKKKDFLFIEKLGLSDCVDMQKADEYANNCFDVLGSGKQCFATMPWHSDFRLQQQQTTNDVSFDAHAFYRDIKINAGQGDALAKDIKLPWELSRFQHLVILGNAYAHTKNELYAQTCVRHLSGWLDHNPYLLGPNWVCPMDVGIRATNWIVGFYFFKDAPSIDEVWWQRFVCSLYDHMLYLENNWEIYDSITSNHYLSDLIGYFYLCYFFSDLPGIEEKTNWCYQELMREFDKQVFDEGADYEGSTRYHGLVAEIFYHFLCLAEAMHFVVPDAFKHKLARMLEFIDWCTPQQGTLIQIGDNDSGMLVAGISPAWEDANRAARPSLPGEASCEAWECFRGACDEKMYRRIDGHTPVNYFPQYGLSIIKTESWHIVLRHAAYEKKQPTGHFHNDAGSITVNVGGVDLFVDPGSYVYTPSKIWRNQFRSVTVHNTFFIEGHEPTPLDDRLFYMPLDVVQTPMKHALEQDGIRLQTYHDLYARYGLRAHRSVMFHEREQSMQLQDRWERMSDHGDQKDLVSCWNFTLGPTITVEKIDDGLMLLHEKQPLAAITSSLPFEVHEGWHSPSYGTKVPCKYLKARAGVHTDEMIVEVKIF